MLLIAIALADCPDPEPSLEAAEVAVRDFLPDVAVAELQAVVRKLGCGEPVPAEIARRYWIAQGVLWSYESDARAPQAFATSRQRESVWNPMFGAAEPEVTADDRTEFAIWTFAKPSTTLHDLVLPDGAKAWSDGDPLERPFQLSEGVHLLQVGGQEGIGFSAALEVSGPVEPDLPPELIAVPIEPVPAPEPEPSTEPEPALQPAPVPTTTVVVPTSTVRLDTRNVSSRTVRAKKRHPSRGLLISGLVIGAMGAGGLGTAAVTKNRYDSSDPDDNLYFANLAAGIGGFGLASTGGLLIGTSLIVNKW